ncbi:MAG: KH domain-containing protein [Cyanobacteria bacterium REEB459]|nr:KH domain-containing protein [Cyanobacteria bacterium REEB459]
MSTPDFSRLVKFLVEPFLDSPDTLRVDCEANPVQAKVWIRIAFDADDRGKVFGRGGRNIQAIRSVIRATAALWGWLAYFDVYGVSDQDGTPSQSAARPTPKPSPRSKPQLRPKS